MMIIISKGIHLVETILYVVTLENRLFHGPIFNHPSDTSVSASKRPASENFTNVGNVRDNYYPKRFKTDQPGVFCYYCKANDHHISNCQIRKSKGDNCVSHAQVSIHVALFSDQNQ